MRNDLEDFLIKCLAEKGYDGLANPELDCGCWLSDFAPCGEPEINECYPGYHYKTKDGDVIMVPALESKTETKD